MPAIVFVTLERFSEYYKILNKLKILDLFSNILIFLMFICIHLCFGLSKSYFLKKVFMLLAYLNFQYSRFKFKDQPGSFSFNTERNLDKNVEKKVKLPLKHVAGLFNRPDWIDYSSSSPRGIKSIRNSTFSYKFIHCEKPHSVNFM